MIEILTAAVLVTSLVGNVLSIFGKRKAEKKARRVESALGAVIKGVEEYSEVTRDSKVKDVIERFSVSNGIEDVLNPLVKKFTR